MNMPKSPIPAVTLAALGAGLLIAGCAVGPKYQRPTVEAPQAHRVASDAATARPGTNSLADLAWQQVYQDPQLAGYIGEALTNSWDARIAASRILQAEAAARVARSRFFPNLSAGGDLVSTRASQNGPSQIPSTVNPQKEYGDVFLSMSAYEVDLWGRIRRANEASRARLLATVEARNAVLQTLVASVAATYLELLELDLELNVSRRTLEARKSSLELTQARQEGGVASMQDVHQSQILVSTAQAAIANGLRRLEQKENEFNLLLGRNPGQVPRAAALDDRVLPGEVPAGLPSALLDRRPDIRLAEQQLIEANADIGQAKAAFYPQLTLTGFGGFQSVALSDLFTGASRTWQFGPSLTVPVFSGGRLRGDLKAAQARFEEAVAQYRKTVQGSFREVSDALIAYQRTREFRARQEERTQAHRGASELAGVRYQGGVTSYLEVLYNEQELFSAELALGQARLDELLSVVSLYKALGGGVAPDAFNQPAPVPTAAVSNSTKS